MTTAIIGVGNIGSTVARELAAGGETVLLATPDAAKVKALALEIGPKASVAASNQAAVQGAEAVIFALRFDVLRGVISELGASLSGKVVIETSNPIAIDATGKVSRTLPIGTSAGEVVSGLLPSGAPFAKAFGSVTVDLLASGSNRTPTRAVLFYATDADEAASTVERLIQAAGFDPVRVGGITAAGRIEVGGDLHSMGGLNGRLVDKSEAQSLV